MAVARLAFLAISMALLSSVALATNHTVGDDKGWALGIDYAAWAKDKVFLVGDNLLFNYNKTKHNVLKVNGEQFKNCKFPDANGALSSGKDVVPLNSTGKKWYVCGKDNHCSSGLKLVITVQASDGPSPSPSPSPSPTTPSASAPSSASSVLFPSASGVVVAAMAALAAFFA